MSKEFNNKRAWDEFINPEFKKLPKNVLKAVKATVREASAISQIGSSMQVRGQSAELTAMFDAISTEDLAWAHEVVHNLGHLASDKRYYKNGVYWKFQDLASMSLINRKPYDGEPLHHAKLKIEAKFNEFHDHVEGTKYDNEEIPEYIKSLAPNIGEDVLEILKVDNVNHKPDVFCIGPRHFPKDGGMYIKPEQAPCAHCKQDYSAHTYDTAMFVKVINEEKLGPALNSLKELCAEHKIKIDGFALVK